MPSWFNFYKTTIKVTTTGSKLWNRHQILPSSNMELVQHMLKVVVTKAYSTINRNSAHILLFIDFQWLTYCFAQLLYIVSSKSMIVVLACYNQFIKTVIQQSGIWYQSCDAPALSSGLLYCWPAYLFPRFLVVWLGDYRTSLKRSYAATYKYISQNIFTAKDLAL